MRLYKIHKVGNSLVINIPKEYHNMFNQDIYLKFGFSNTILVSNNKTDWIHRKVYNTSKNKTKSIILKNDYLNHLKSTKGDYLKIIKYDDNIIFLKKV